MKTLHLHCKSGAAVVALMLVAVIILGSMLMLHTAAVVSVGSTSRALEIARQNAATAVRLERVTREAVQSVYGIAATPSTRALREELESTLGAAPLGALEVAHVEIQGNPSVPRSFPSLIGPAADLAEKSPELNLMATPQLLAFAGSRVAESAPFTIRYGFSRTAVASSQTYRLDVTFRLVAVPLTRFAITAYDLPSEIGAASSPSPWPAFAAAKDVAPRGLVPDRDPAAIEGLRTGDKRPAYYRNAAALAEAYQYVFSQSYLQNASDCAGLTHFVQIGAGPANPRLDGGNESGNTYTLDIARFGMGALGATVATKNLAVFSSGVTSRLVLTDSGGATTPILLVVAGPADLSVSSLLLELDTPLQRPLVLICYHVQITAVSGCSVNGALLLDPQCQFPAVEPLTVGHASYWGGGVISGDVFRTTSMPASAENLAPRVVYVATSKAAL